MTGEPLKGLTDNIYGLAVSPDEQTLVGVSYNGGIMKWKIEFKLNKI